MGTKAAPLPTPSNGAALEYKAFARSFQGGSAAVLYLFATCYYGTPGFKLFFEAQSGLQQFELLQTAPQGIEPQLVTYYVADWTSSQPLASPPTHVKIKDAHGNHEVPVHRW
jgi:hypothetical protein